MPSMPGSGDKETETNRDSDPGSDFLKPPSERFCSGLDFITVLIQWEKQTKGMELGTETYILEATTEGHAWLVGIKSPDERWERCTTITNEKTNKAHSYRLGVYTY